MGDRKLCKGRHQPSGFVWHGGPDGRQASLQDGPPDAGQRSLL